MRVYLLAERTPGAPGVSEIVTDEAESKVAMSDRRVARRFRRARAVFGCWRNTLGGSEPVRFIKPVVRRPPRRAVERISKFYARCGEWRERWLGGSNDIILCGQ